MEVGLVIEAKELRDKLKDAFSIWRERAVGVGVGVGARGGRMAERRSSRFFLRLVAEVLQERCVLSLPLHPPQHSFTSRFPHERKHTHSLKTSPER
jgi:hypothetical protein